jgi:hypothetical protein
MAVSLSALRAGRSAFTPPPLRFLVLISAKGLVDPRAVGQLKYPITSLGIESTTFRLVTWCLNQLPCRLPLFNEVIYSYINSVRTSQETRLRYRAQPVNAV